MNESLVTGLDFPFDIAVWGDHIFVANPDTGVVGKYTTDGTTVNASLISGFPGLTALTVADGFLYVVDAVNGTISVLRPEEAIAAGARTLARACPFCSNMMTDGVAGTQGGENVNVLDIAELLLSRQSKIVGGIRAF